MMDWKKLAIVLTLNLSLCGFLQASPAQGPKKFPSGDGTVRLFNYHLNETIEITFRDTKGRTDPKALENFNKFLRSRDNAEITPIDPQLLDLLDHLQDYYEIDTVEIISGYRRPELNQNLLTQGRRVSPRSLHMQGKAIDIHIDEIKEETLRDYLQSLNLGGVGYYGPLDFIHVDTGRYKTWGGSDSFARKLIGILDSGAPVQLTSDKNDYLPNDAIFFTWDFSKGYDPKDVRAIGLEHFWRGKWVHCPVQKLPEKKSILPIASLDCPQGTQKQGYGKYRWVFKAKGSSTLLSSNEFYLKKK